MNRLDPRAADLLSDEALVGLDEAEQRELEELLGERLEAERQTFGRAMASLDLAHTPADAAMPEALRARILAQAPAALGPAQVVPLVTRAPASNDTAKTTRGGWAPWVVAAVAAAAAVIAIATRPSTPPGPQVVTVERTVTVPMPSAPTPTPDQARAALLAREGAVRIAWSATKDPAAKEATGDVVWSASEQKGYMTFRGLPANDPQKSQYQLWIFDKNQDQRYPVDGGVFDVGPGGEIVVPIEAKLNVREATLFAITIEKPGGVVVSDRKRLVLAAKVPTGLGFPPPRDVSPFLAALWSFRTQRGGADVLTRRRKERRWRSPRRPPRITECRGGTTRWSRNRSASRRS